MLTGLSTNVQLADGTRYRPKTLRALTVTSMATGTTQRSEAIETHKYRGVRVRYVCDGLVANSTLQFNVVTGPTSDPTQDVRSSSGAVSLLLSSTGRGSRTYTGLDRWIRLNSRLDATGAAAGPCTGFQADVELV
jgi:hypothetical protein